MTSSPSDTLSSPASGQSLAMPFGTDSSPMFPAASPSGRSLLDRHRAGPTESVTKVGSSSFSPEALESARAERAAVLRTASQRGTSTPFATQAGEGGTTGSGLSHHYLKPHAEAELTAKIGAGYKSPPKVQQREATEPGKTPWDQQGAEEACRQRAVAQAAARQRNAGTPGLLG